MDGAGEFWTMLVLAVLATWRVSHLLAYEDGPADVIVRIRRRLGDRPAGNLMDCLNCVSLWVAAPLAVLLSRGVVVGVLSWLAISGAACLLQRLAEGTGAAEPTAPPMEGDDHVLR